MLHITVEMKYVAYFQTNRRRRGNKNNPKESKTEQEAKTEN